MKSRSPAHHCALAVVWLLTNAFASSAARGNEAKAAVVEPGSDADKQARALFAQGQVHYSLGEYEQAIGKFRRAYELTSAPGLLFNIAQAHRLNGDCKQALEVYRHFVRLAPESEYRGEAATQIAALILRCGAPPPTSPGADQGDRGAADARADAPVLLSSPKLDLTTKPAPRWSTRRKSAAVLCAGGVGLGLAAGAVTWWNNGRYDDWRTEDQRLAAMPGSDPQVWIGRQQRNDALLHSIQRVDSIDLVLAGLSVAAVLTSAVLVIAFDR
jgi:tetratricopeptide (TPR) repeat protein